MHDNVEQNVNPWSRPSQLKITDLRVATVTDMPMRSVLIRIDTNQDIYGLGEVRDYADKVYVLMLKSRILGENPCHVDRLFRMIKQFGHHGRQAGGVSAIEMALMDLAGKAYGVPAYQLAGGMFRDRIRCYCDTEPVADGYEMGRRLQERIDRGFTFLKMDLGIDRLHDCPGGLSAPSGALDTTTVMHPFTGIQITDHGIDILCEYAAAVRQTIGYDVPLAVDHFGHIGLESCIRLGQALDRFNFAWYEDMLPWQFADQYVQLSRAVRTPICTGEDIYLKEGFQELFESRGISVVHPDLATAGGILETKKIGDLAQDHGIVMALHMAMSPIAAYASVHCAAATENFLVLENHSVDVPSWDNMVHSPSKPIIKDGFIEVPQTPGLGIESLNEEVLREHLDPQDPGFFEPTNQWNDKRSHDRLWS